MLFSFEDQFLIQIILDNIKKSFSKSVCEILYVVCPPFIIEKFFKTISFSLISKSSQIITIPLFRYQKFSGLFIDFLIYSSTFFFFLKYLKFKFKIWFPYVSYNFLTDLADKLKIYALLTIVLVAKGFSNSKKLFFPLNIFNVPVSTDNFVENLFSYSFTKSFNSRIWIISSLLFQSKSSSISLMILLLFFISLSLILTKINLLIIFVSFSNCSFIGSNNAWFLDWIISFLIFLIMFSKKSFSIILSLSRNLINE